MYALLISIFVSVATAELLPDQRPYADVDFPITLAGRPRLVYNVIEINGFIIARTELGIFRIHRRGLNGRRRADVVISSGPGKIISMERETDRKIICGISDKKTFTIDVTVEDPLRTFQMSY